MAWLEGDMEPFYFSKDQTISLEALLEKIAYL